MAERKKPAAAGSEEHKMAEVHVHHHHHHHHHGKEAKGPSKAADRKGGEKADRMEKRKGDGEFGGDKRPRAARKK